ncbi:GNAT family N-acetyltransferase [Paraburkholderia sp. DD10]|uniref:Acetyltransferase (GNAT) family protein n=1 Tax=Paraburkholderia terricola TaxID=169427 RepID=A0A1M6RBW2_9BURK|nr:MULTISPECIES: GNAT family N-acetyltransferase [Paraburkholderia]AXE96413.1 N-acetyltransferase [Paraburkholderia terricola]ORC45406.1 GNAT family N-acetyltransferase [Burkholderia sp. A27]SDP21431.1 Acetyltransferase (GNAT) family protein [Paraburkholderia sediminicola]SHK29954.1 Acetyltransferase (GNAT) family protein [Paraburkholderia terricola]
MQAAELTISSDKADLDIEMIHAFLSRQTAWAQGMPRDTLERAIAGSLCFGGYVGGRQIAFARLITDEATFAYLCDVFVLPDYRGKGYASALMKHVFASPSLTGLRRIVLVTTDAHHVYRPHGFRELANPERYMELHDPDVYKTA